MRQAPQRTVLEEVTVVIAGPTASGKTDLAVELARAVNGEIISADSRQVYRDLDAGTAKPARDPNGLVRGIAYHLIDVANPGETFDAGRFLRLALDIRRDILSRGRVPIVAGGTGLYLNALLNGLAPLPQADPDVRGRLSALAEKNGRGWLMERLREVDPLAAGKIPPNNLQRMIRALEVRELTGRPISSFWNAAGHGGLKDRAAVFVIESQAEELRERIRSRTEAMWPAMIQEVQRLVPSRYKGTEPGFQSLGYRDAIACARGDLSEREGLDLMIKSTLAYAKRQRTWFRNQLKGAAAIRGTITEMAGQVLNIVTPTKAGVQQKKKGLDSGFRRNDRS